MSEVQKLAMLPLVSCQGERVAGYCQATQQQFDVGRLPHQPLHHILLAGL